MDTEQKKEIGRNEPCPCGSGKKYKRCCGVGAAPKLSLPAEATGATAAGPAGMPGFDPSQLDPAMLAGFRQQMQRLPKGQLQKMQSLMQKAMGGKDITREAAELERTLPPDFKHLMMGLQMATGGMGAGAAAPAEMTPEEARKIVEEAAAKGKISQDKAQALLTPAADAAPGIEGSGEAPAKDKGISKLWKKVTGK